MVGEKSSTYADSGVNIKLGDDVSKILYNAAKATWDNRKGKLGELIVPFDDFSGVRAINVGGLPKGTLMNIGFDGVGTKMEIAERINDHTTIAYDLFAMVCDDAVVRGAEPVIIGSILDVNSLGKGEKNHMREIKELAIGYVNAAKDAGVAVVNGEVAELGNRVGGYGSDYFALNLAHQYISVNLHKDNWNDIKLLSSFLIEKDSRKKQNLYGKLRGPEKIFVNNIEKSRTLNYNWGATIAWFAQKDRMFTGNEIKEGDSIVGLREIGFRSNGLSLVRKIMQEKCGDDWHKVEFDGSNLGKQVLTPSKIYSKAVCEMFGGYNGKPKVEVHGVAHITGGGLPGKLGRVLRPSGLGADINNPFHPSDIMGHIQKLGNVSDEEAYQTWNMGQGMVVITPEPGKVIGIASTYGIGAQEIGNVVKEPGIILYNKGAFRLKKGKTILEFKD